MSFEDAMRRILHVITEDGITYVPYITRSRIIPDIGDPIRSDYDDPRDNNIHGGVDIIYCKLLEDGTKEYIGADKHPNDIENDGDVLATVYAPVSGEIIAVSPLNGDGGVSILDENGYVHTIYHMDDIDREKIKKGVDLEQGDEIGKMAGMNDGDPDAWHNHVHYEITTYYQAGIARQRKIDPEAFWNNEEAFELAGSYKKGNIFYGTLNNEIIKGEGVIDRGSAIDSSDDDILLGGGGSDIIFGGRGDDQMFGGRSYAENLYYVIEEGILNKNAEEDTDESADTLIGGMGKDKLYGGKGNDVLYGGEAFLTNGEVNYDPSRDEDASEDELYGGEGDDTLWGGTGQDHMEGGEGNDTFKIIGTDEAYDEFYGGEGEEDKIEGSDENDTIRVNKFEGDATVEIIDGGDGDEDKIAGTNLADTIDLSETELVDIEKIETGDLNDTIKLGEELGNLEGIDGGSGDEDTIIYNDSPNDIFIGVELEDGQSESDITLTGIEKIDGAGGDDKFYWSNNTQVKYIDGGDGNNEIIGSDSSAAEDADIIDLNKIETKNIKIVKGRKGDDQITGDDEGNEIYGGDGIDIIKGGEGENFLYGDDGDDTLIGGSEHDEIFGGEGNDRLLGGEGVDRLEGGKGDDTYKADNGDTILDSDHNGRVHFGGTVLSGGTKKEGNDYWEGNGGTYTLSDGTLTFKLGPKDGNGPSVTILNYDKEQHSLEIHLEEEDSEEQAFSSPLVLDLNNNDTLSVTEYDSPAYFDLDGDGFKEKTGWIEAEDGLLALDRNENGIIDNGNELFGSYTKDKNGNYFDNRFAILKSAA